MPPVNIIPSKIAPKSDAKAAPAKASAPSTPAAADPLAALKAKVATLPAPAQTLILKAAGGTKLTKEEVGTLRTLRLTKSGDPIKAGAPKGPRAPKQIDKVAVANVVEFAGIEGLHKAFTKYGEALKRPLLQYAKALTDADDKSAILALAKTFFPRAAGTGAFAKKDSQVVSKHGRVAILASAIAGPGGHVKVSGPITLADGRVGLFVEAVSASEASAQPVGAPEATPAWMAPAASGASPSA